jgi:hypothetical protein
MSSGDLLLSFPMFALARDANPNPATGMMHYRGFHARRVNWNGEGQHCLILFATEDSARQYAARRTALANTHLVTITDKMELETVLADCRQLGVEFVMIAANMPQQGIVRLCDLGRGLDALD